MRNLGNAASLDLIFLLLPSDSTRLTNSSCSDPTITRCEHEMQTPTYKVTRAMELQGGNVRVSEKGSLIENFAGHLLYSVAPRGSTHREFVFDSGWGRFACHWLNAQVERGRLNESEERGG